jgi:hypothetical protein
VMLDEPQPSPIEPDLRDIFQISFMERSVPQDPTAVRWSAKA